MILGVLHHGITVSDIEESIKWYRDALGLELVHRQHSDNEYIRCLVGVEDAVLDVAQFRINNGLPRVSTHDLELIQYVKGGTTHESPVVNQVGVAHLGFLVSDVATLYEQASERGATFRNEPTMVTEGANQGSFACYLHDPDGNTLEFIQPAPTRMAAIQAILDDARGVQE